MVTRDNPEATEALCNLIMDRISLMLRGHGTYSVRPEIALLAALIQKEDSCWELKLRLTYYHIESPVALPEGSNIIVK